MEEESGVVRKVFLKKVRKGFTDIIQLWYDLIKILNPYVRFSYV